MRRFYLVATVLAFIFSALLQGNVQPAQSTHAIDLFDAEACQVAQDTLQEYILAHSIRLTASLLHCEVSDDWAYATAVYTDPDARTPVSAEPFLLLIRKEPTGSWHALLPVVENAIEYDAWLNSIPTELIPAAWRDYVRMTNHQFGIASATSIYDYRLPWADGWRGTVLQGAHDVYAIDFDLWGGDWGYSQSEDSWIVAARDGVVVYAKDVSTQTVVCNGGYDGWWYANMVVIGHGTLNPATHRYPEYSWYVHLAPNSVPEYVRPGAYIRAGEVIGQEGKTGCSTDGKTVHLHFEVSNDFPGATTRFTDTVDAATGAVLQREQHSEHAPWPLTHPMINWVLPSTCTLSYGSAPCTSETNIQRDNAVILYWDADYHGPAIRYAQDNVNGRCVPESNSGKFLCNIPTFLNDRISSIQVNQEGQIFVKLHQDANGYGFSRGWWWTEANFDNDFYDAESALGQLMRPLNDSISSLFIDCDPCGNTFMTSNRSPVALQQVSADSDPPLPLCGGTPTLPTTDFATFLSDVTLPDGSVVSPGQALHKIWRVRNSGTSTWGPGYQLVFIGGNRMGAPASISIPTTAPGATADLTVNITAPSSGGSYTSRWRLRNTQGVYFGDELWINITVPGGTPPVGDEISLSCVNCPSTVTPDQQFRPTIRATVNSGQLLQSRGDMLRNTDGNLYGAWPHVAVVGTINAGQTYDFVFYADNPITAPSSEGTYETKWRIWRNGNWAGPEITIRFQVRQMGGTNYPPNPPTLTGPGDWAIFQGNPVVLTAQHNGDPDGDAITGYYFELLGPNPRNSGWIESNTWSPQGLPYSNYEWHVKVRDSRGAESGWSPQLWHFNVLNNEPEIYDFHWEWCREAWGGPEKICFCARTNAGTLRVMANTATDGSDRGEWRIINELGVPEYRCVDDSDRPPNTDNLEWETGTHLVRLYARREGGWENAAYRDITFSLPANRRPDTPFSLQPLNDAYVGSRTVRLDWKDTLRTTEYRLEASTDPGYSTHLIDLRLPSGTSEYIHTFGSDYATVYWRVTAIGPYGTNGGTGSGSTFHIDIMPPSSSVTSLPAVTTDTSFAVSWGGSDARSGVRWYDVQFRDSPRGDWITWLSQTTLSSAIFQGQPGHVYYFRCRAMDSVGNWEAYPSGDGDTYSLVDPTAAPPTAWWNQSYAYKRNVIVLNNDSRTLPPGYPVHILFNASTAPTAEELYNASQSPTKGDDFRVIYNNTIELERYIRVFSPSKIDIWFQTQANIPASTSDNNYQLYYGNIAPGTPPGSIQTVMVPPGNANTIGLWYLQEAGGTIAHDSSGQNHHGTLRGTPTWTENGKWGSCLQFSGADNEYIDLGSLVDWNLNTYTIEAWVYPEAPDGRVFSRWKQSTSDPILFMLGLEDWKPFYWSEDGGGHVWSPRTIPANTWTHLAAVRDGSRSRLYINGVEVASTPHGSWDDSANGPLVLAGRLQGCFQGFRFSNIALSSFPYGQFAQITNEPSLAAGSAISKPEDGAPDLSVYALSSYPSPSGGVIVQSVVRNDGDAATTNGFYTDLYANHLPAGSGDFTGSIRYWVATPIEAGATLTLTTAITGINSPGWLSAARSPLEETTITLYTQTDSSGVVPETNETNNISSATNICVASADAYESAVIPNLLLNGSFEDGAFAPDADPTAWTRDAWDWSRSTFTWDNGQTHSGTRSIKITNETANDARWTQTVPVEPNTDYRLSGWIRTEGVAHTQESIDAGANISVFDSPQFRMWTYAGGLFGDNDWTYVSLVFNTGDITELTIAPRLGYWYGTTTGAAWFDDLRLEPIHPAAPDMLNPGFEDGPYSPDGNPAGWTRDVWDIYRDTALIWDNVEHHGGSRSVRVTNNDPNNAGWVQTVTVEPHTQYRLSGWIRTENVAHTQETVDAGANLAVYDLPHLRVYAYVGGLLGTNDWTYVSLAFNSGEATELIVAARLGCMCGITTGTAWFDDLRLELLSASSPGDDIVAGAQPITVGETQHHNLHRPGDQDWTRFAAQGGATYTIYTSNVGPSADTYVYLYDADGSTLLAANDDYGGSLASRLDWTAPMTGTYYVLVRHWNPNVGGCGNTYDLTVMRALTNRVFLPAVMRSR